MASPISRGAGSIGQPESRGKEEVQENSQKEKVEKLGKAALDKPVSTGKRSSTKGRARELTAFKKAKTDLDALEKAAAVREEMATQAAGMTFASLPREIHAHIRGFTSAEDIARGASVSKSWKNATPQIQINGLNTGIPPIVMFPGKSAREIVDWIANNPSCNLLEYADFDDVDFSGINGFDNACLEKLTKNCPGLKHLLIPDAEISGDALKHLEKTPGLQSLDIEGCEQLEPDALKHLEKTPGLQSLDIEGCEQLEPDALKHLEKTPGLQSLNIRGCSQLEPDALKHLEKTPGLQSLNIAMCTQLERDALKHLEKTPALQSLNTRGCSQLEDDALKHLEKTLRLQSLNIAVCKQLEPDALKHLEKTPGLQSLNIAMCKQLEAGALKHLEKTPGLQSLNINGCTQLEAGALKHLEKTPRLQSLNIRWCSQLERDALKHLKKTPGLQSLDIEGCEQLDENVCLKSPIELFHDELTPLGHAHAQAHV